MRVSIKDRIIGDSNMVSTGVFNKTLVVFRQQINHNNHEIVNTLTNHMASILNPLLRTTHESYQ